MLQLLIVLATVAAGVVLSRPVPTEELLQDRFALGQRYYAANDHENSVEIFQELQRTPNYALLDVDDIDVAIDDLILPLRVAATYQLGNSYRNVGRTLLERSQSLATEGDSTGARGRRQESLTAFDQARDYYRTVVDDEGRAPLKVRVMAQYQIVRASYQTQDYEGVVRETRILLGRFPGSEYEDAALYDRGWSYYYMDRYREAIATFEELLAVTDDALKRDRALFQMGESYVSLGELESARAAYRRLIGLYDFGRLSDKELRQMRTQRLRGLVRETTRELVAKAQIRIADSYASEGRVDEAIEAYSQVPTRYPQETLLVQKSYDNMATMVLERQGPVAGIRVLRRAIEAVDDTYFRGRAQLRIAGILFRAGRYREAIPEYEVYRRAYGDHAAAIGVDLDQVLYFEGEAYRQVAASPAPGSDADLRAARRAYRRLLDDYPRSERVPEAWFGLGQVYATTGHLDSAATAFDAAVESGPRSAVAPYALSRRARIAFKAGDAQGAIDLYRRLVSQYPHSELIPAALKDMGLVYKSVGRIDDAVAALTAVDSSYAAWPKVQAEAADMLLAAARLDAIDEKLQMQHALAAAAAAGDEESVAELHYVLGRVARERGDHEAEIAHFDQVLAHSRNTDLSTYARFFRGLAHYQVGATRDAARDSLGGTRQYELALEDLAAVLAGPINAQMRLLAFRTRGVTLTRLGRSQDAVSAYQELIAAATSPQERAEFQLMLMELYYDLGQLAETRAIARQLVEARFEEDVGAGLSIRDRAYFVLVSVLLQEEAYAEAYRTAQDALRRFPQSPNRPTLMLVSARALFFNEEYDRAVAAFAAFVQAYPEDSETPQALYQLGYANEILGRYEQAAAAFQDLARGFPRHELAADALYRAGENLYNASRFEAALAQFLRVLEAFPHSDAAAKALYSASWTYMDLDREADSIAAMQRLVAEYPGSDLARYAQFSIGDYYYSKKRFAQAEAAYRVVVDRFPGTPEADKARQLINDVREDLASLAYDEVFGDFQSGDYAAAIKGFQRIFERYPDSYSALAALANKGVALEHVGDSEAARRTYERVLAKAADDPETRDISRFVRLRLESL